MAGTKPLQVQGRDARRPGLVAEQPSIPAALKRSCQRQTLAFDLPVWRMIAAVPTPSADNKMIIDRQTCFCAALRSLTTRSSRRRSTGEMSNLIPVRIAQNRTPQAKMGIPKTDSSVRRYPLAWEGSQGAALPKWMLLALRGVAGPGKHGGCGGHIIRRAGRR